MELYLIRHADAVTLGEGGVVDDASRPLTPTGEAQARQLAEGLTRRGIRFDIILTSPLVRARQTAEGLVAHLEKPAPEVRVTDELAPGGKRRKLARILKNLGKESIALVGHQPDLGEFAGWLIGSKKTQIAMAKAGVARIHVEAEPGKGEGQLIWLVTLDWLNGKTIT
jgi:phosphohistidine phosphatase